MACAAQKDDSSPKNVSESEADQYHVYVHYNHQGGAYRPGWEKKKTTCNKMNALRAAQALRRRKRYVSVEVKKTAFDPYASRYTNKTFKTYGQFSKSRDYIHAIPKAKILFSAVVSFVLGVAILRMLGLL